MEDEISGEAQFCYRLDKELSEAEKSLLLRFLEDKTLEISVKRTDFSGQEWGFDFSVPFTLNKQESDSFAPLAGQIPPLLARLNSPT